MPKKIEICAEIKRVSDAAYLVTDDGETDNWIPRSQVEMDQDGGVGDTVIFTMPEWLAAEKGFI